MRTPMFSRIFSLASTRAVGQDGRCSQALEYLAMILDVEVKVFQRERSGLLFQKGKYVLIQGEKVLGIWATYREALAAGYAKCGLETAFLVRQILERDATHYFA